MTASSGCGDSIGRGEIPVQLEPGDVVFIRVENFLYRRVAESTRTWSSHVGLLYGKDSLGRWQVAESTVPLSRLTRLERFHARSLNGAIAIRRMRGGLNQGQREAVLWAAKRRMGTLYHLGFDYDSRRQYCSKFIYDIFQEALGVEVGQLETFRTLLERNRGYPLTFWKLWFLGRIPWNRRVVSPGTQYASARMETVFEQLPDSVIPASC